jgi:hypothetical protein
MNDPLSGFIAQLFITILPVAVICAIFGGIVGMLMKKGEKRRGRR